MPCKGFGRLHLPAKGGRWGPLLNPRWQIICNQYGKGRLDICPFPSVDWTLSGINRIVSGSGQLPMQL